VEVRECLMKLTNEVLPRLGTTYHVRAVCAEMDRLMARCF
jgi:hypothetical protein